MQFLRRVFPGGLVAASIPNYSEQAEIALRGGGGGEATPLPTTGMIHRPKYFRAAPLGVGLSPHFGKVMKDTGHVSKQ